MGRTHHLTRSNSFPNLTVNTPGAQHSASSLTSLHARTDNCHSAIISLPFRVPMQWHSDSNSVFADSSADRPILSQPASNCKMIECLARHSSARTHAHTLRVKRNGPPTIFSACPLNDGHVAETLACLVEPLRYKPGGRGFDSR
jgi:hypothetical protein